MTVSTRPPTWFCDPSTRGPSLRPTSGPTSMVGSLECRGCKTEGRKKRDYNIRSKKSVISVNLKPTGKMEYTFRLELVKWEFSKLVIL